MKIKGREVTFSNIINFILGGFERIFSYRYFNLWKTIYVNFRCLPFSEAVKFPVIIYGGVKVISLMGKIEIRSDKIKRRMLRLGAKSHYEFVRTNGSRLHIDGKLVIGEHIEFANGYQIVVTTNSTLTLGSECYFGENLSLIAYHNIEIGEAARIAYNSVVMDTDVHFSINTITREVSKNMSPIKVGAMNWIGNGARIMKGTITPDWTIVTAGSFLNKDYTKTIPAGAIIGGSPAKLIREGQKRVFSEKSESVLNKFFQSNPQQTKYILPEDIDLTDFCRR